MQKFLTAKWRDLIMANFEVEPSINVDFARTYGDDFAQPSNEKPHSVLLVKDSEIAVYKGERIK